jgi:hypothetical protein
VKSVSAEIGDKELTEYIKKNPEEAKVLDTCRNNDYVAIAIGPLRVITSAHSEESIRAKLTKMNNEVRVHITQIEKTESSDALFEM